MCSAGWITKGTDTHSEYVIYEAYAESKYRFAVKKSSKVSYKILLLSDSTFFKLFFQHIRRHY